MIEAHFKGLFSIVRKIDQSPQLESGKAIWVSFLHELRVKLKERIFAEIAPNFPIAGSSCAYINEPITKTFVQRIIYFMSANTEFVFSKHSKHGEWLLSYNVRNTLRREVCEKTGVYWKSPHKIRATYDTILLDNGIDNKTVTELMGHSDIRVSERNYPRNRKKIADKQTLLNNIGEFGNYKIG